MAPEVPPDVVTVTVTVAAVCDGVLTVSEVVPITWIVVPWYPAPNVTVGVPVRKLVPVRVTTVPPATLPDVGVIAVRVGGRL